MEVRPVRPEEGLLYRQLRLCALSEARDAYGETLSNALLRPRQWWVHRVHEISENSDREVLFLALNHGQPSGLLYVRLEATTAHFYGMWVARFWRRLGNGTALLNAGLLWAKARKADYAELWVTEANAAAMRLYETFRFRDTGVREPLREGSLTRTRQMILYFNEV